jgi:lipopolysaccharide biosynthesis glycosyltransferase
LHFRVKCNSGTYVVVLNAKKCLHVKINNKEFTTRIKSTYYFICNAEDELNININRMFENEIDMDHIQEFLKSIDIFKYGEPILLNNKKYQILWSFDSNYYHGAFTSIYSLLHNFDRDRLKDLNVNLCIPEVDFDSVNKEIGKFIRICKDKGIEVEYTLSFSTPDVVHKVFLDTQCFKGGSHLLKLSNFSRLIVGHLYLHDKLLYIDSDTIIQTDMSKCLDKIVNTNYVVLGKKANLNYTNLINVNNVSAVLRYLPPGFNLKNNVIYTGTMVFNCKQFIKYYPKIIELVKRHNATPNGIYKLFTMSIINLAINNDCKYADQYINNVVDLGFKAGLEELNDKADVLDWSGMFKPWFNNGLYKEYWTKYNVMYEEYPGEVMYIKDTTEKSLK